MSVLKLVTTSDDLATPLYNKCTEAATEFYRFIRESLADGNLINLSNSSKDLFGESFYSFIKEESPLYYSLLQIPFFKDFNYLSFNPSNKFIMTFMQSFDWVNLVSDYEVSLDDFMRSVHLFLSNHSSFVSFDSLKLGPHRSNGYFYYSVGNLH